MRTLGYYRSNRATVPTLTIAIALAMVVVIGSFYFGRSAEAGHVPDVLNVAQSSSTCQGVNISPGDDLAAIINADPVGRGTTFCIERGTYSPNTVVNLNEGDALIGPEGALASRGPATYPTSLLA